MSSLKDAAASEVARAKIEADRIAAIIDKNLASLHDKAMNHKFLFADAGQLVLKDPEAVEAIIDQRITAQRGRASTRPRKPPRLSARKSAARTGRPSAKPVPGRGRGSRPTR